MEAQKESVQRDRVLIIVAKAMTVRAFLIEYLKALTKDFDVALACSSDDPQIVTDLPASIEFFPIEIKRDINPIADLSALWKLVGMMRNHHFDMIHSVTPKAGLLAHIAARWCGVAIRLHTFTGQVWATRRGLARWFLKMLDRLLSSCATHLIADSKSQKVFIVAEGVALEKKITVIGEGSISGVDGARFKTDLNVRRNMREKLGYSDDDVLALFVGRLTRDKGVLDLATAFARVSDHLPNLVLLVVGPDEGCLKDEIISRGGANTRIRLLGETKTPEDYMASSDFFCLPSYREGFGTVVIEAAACGLPTIASAIYGLTDAVVDGVTGVLHRPGDVDEIARLLENFTYQATWRKQLGLQAQERALSKFLTENVVAAEVHFVTSLLEQTR